MAALSAALAFGAQALAGADGPTALAAAACASCHGTDGASPGASIPIIGGQTEQYLASALKDYKSGARDIYIMRFIANGFGDDRLTALAQHFSGLPWAPTQTPFDPEKAALGEERAQTLCVACHGASGEGTPIGPRIGGQPVFYLAEAMKAYLEGTRHTAPGATMMQQVLSGIDPAEIEGLAHYYTSLR